MKEKSTSKKRIVLVVAILLLLGVAAVAGALMLGGEDKGSYEFTLNERDVKLDEDGTLQLELIPDDVKNKDVDVKVAWESSNPSVATVDKDGKVTAKDGGEARITAVVKYGGKEFSSYCVITVEGKGLEYSTYKLRYFTQRKDRGGYDVTEETYERLVGSEVEMTAKDAIKRIPANYVFNKEKSILKGVVKERLGMCILEVYYDVAEITYSVDYYYESATQLGKYTEKETKKLKAYAFTEVVAPENTKDGFAVNTKASGAVMKNSSVVAGSKLKVYCDRIRSEVTFNYVSGKKSATYTCVYGVGLLNAPKSAATDNLEPYRIVGYVDEEKYNITDDFLKKIKQDTMIDFNVDAYGLSYVDGGLLNVTPERNKSSYAYLDGKGKTIYMTATYNTTGSQSHMFGVSIKSGGTSREIRFQSFGVGVMKDHTMNSGVLREGNSTYYYNYPGVAKTPYVFAQNMGAPTGTKKHSAINSMVANKQPGSYDVVWVIWEGTLYAMVQGEVSLALPLNTLEASWTADKTYEIGISTFDGERSEDELKVTNVTVAYDAKAEAKLVTDKRLESAEIYAMGYEPFRGSYMPASNSGASYIYGEKMDKDHGVSADVKWENAKNSSSAAGVTVKVGEESVQFVLEGMGKKVRARQQVNHGWAPNYNLTNSILKYTVTPPIGDEGTYQVKAMVKDDYFYVLYNDVQVISTSMISLFKNYTPDMESAVGIFTWDAHNGQSYFENITFLSKEDVKDITSAQWPYYSNAPTVDQYDFTDGTINKKTEAAQNMQLMGSSKTWELTGTFTRPTRVGKEAAGLIAGFKITSGNKYVRILAQSNGFARELNGWTPSHTTTSWNTGETFRIFEHNNGNTHHAFNSMIGEYFRDNTTRTELPFRAVIYDDVFYVWFDGELCWRVPLTEEDMGGFEKGSEYSVTVQLDIGNKTGGVKDLTSKMGYQVTDVQEFLTYENKSYTIDEATDIIDTNITRWDITVNCDIKGALGEYAVKIPGEHAVRADMLGQYKYWQLDTKMNRSASDLMVGVRVADSTGKNIRFELQNQGFGRIINGIWGAGSWTGYDAAHCDYHIFEHNKGNDLYAFGSTLQKYTSGEVAMKVVIYDDVLYAWFDGVLSWRIPLTEAQFGGFTAGTEYKLALSIANGSKASCDFRDLVIQNGDAVKNQEGLQAKLRTIDANVARWINSEAMRNMTITGEKAEKVTTLQVSGAAYAYLNQAVAGNQAIKATIKLGDVKSAISTGITLKHVASGKSIQIIAESKNENEFNNVRMQFDHAWGSPIWLQTLIPSDVKVYDNGVCNVNVVVKNGKLYVLYNGKQAGAVDLAKLLPSYKSTDLIRLGICGWDCNKGASTFENIEHVTGDAVNNIAVSNTPEWGIRFTAASIAGATVDYLNGTVTKTAGSQQVTVLMNGQSQNWQIEGTMNVANRNLMIGFEISDSTGKRVRIEAQQKGFARVLNGNWLTGNMTALNATDTTKYNIFEHQRGNTAYAFGKALGTYRTGDIKFKAVISGDVLRVWFKDELCWQVPLTEAQFGGFAAGTEYKVAFSMANGTPALGSFKDVTVKTGSEVVAQLAFAKKYSLLGKPLS